MEQILPNDVLRIICSYERCAFMYVNKQMHAEYIKWDTWVYRNCFTEEPSGACYLNIMLCWYEFAERHNIKLYRYILRTMWSYVRKELADIYDRAKRLKWLSYYHRARSLVWTKKPNKFIRL